MTSQPTAAQLAETLRETLAAASLDDPWGLTEERAEWYRLRLSEGWAALAQLVALAEAKEGRADFILHEALFARAETAERERDEAYLLLGQFRPALEAAEARAETAETNERHMRNLHDWRVKDLDAMRVRAEQAERERDAFRLEGDSLPSVSDHADTLREAVKAHVPDGYDQVDLGWTGALQRECLDSIDALVAERGSSERGLMLDLQARAEAAEARSAALEAALRKIATGAIGSSGMIRIASEALAAGVSVSAEENGE